MKNKLKQKRKSLRYDFEVLNIRSFQDEKIITMGMVSTITDSFKTILVPTGCTSPLESVPVDYNHNCFSTGCYLVDLGIQRKTISIIKDVSETEQDIRMVEIHVPETALAITKTNHDLPIDQIPSLYQMVVDGRIRWCSVYFTPDDDFIEVICDIHDKIKRVIYNQWQLNYLSLLDVKPGQDTSIIFNIRSFESLDTEENKMNNVRAGKKYMKKGVKNMSKVKGRIDLHKLGLLNDNVIHNIKLQKPKVRIFQQILNMKKENIQKSNNRSLANWYTNLGDVLKDKDGNIAGVIEINTAELADGSVVSKVSLETIPDGQIVLVDLDQIGDNFDSAEDEADYLWVHVTQFDLINIILNIDSMIDDAEENAGSEEETVEGEDNQEARKEEPTDDKPNLQKDKKEHEDKGTREAVLLIEKPEEKKEVIQTELKETKRVLKQTELNIHKLQKQYQRVLNSPTEPTLTAVDSAIDNISTSENAVDNKSEKARAWAMSQSRFM